MDSGGNNTNNNAYANNPMFANSQQFNTLDNLNFFQNGADSSFTDASWGINASDYPNQNQSRGQQSAPSWQQNANHLSNQSASAGYAGQASPSPYGRPLNQSPTPYAPHAYGNFGAQQAYPYRQQQYDPSLSTQSGNNGHNFNLGMHGYNSPIPNGSTVTPQTLNRPAFLGNPYGGTGYQPNYAQGTANRPLSATPQIRSVDPRTLVSAIPRGANSGMFSVIDFNSLSQATNSQKMGNFVNVGKEAIEFDCSRGVVPAYTPRKSRSELRALAANNPGALSRIGKRSKASLAATRPLLTSDVAGAQRAKEEADTSTDETSSDDDSAYSDDEDDESDSPLPSKRPETPKGGIEYDTIKALWRSKRKTVDGETMKKCLVDFWNLVKTIRDRWKSDTAAYTEAEEKKKTGELPLLQNRVKDGRDMIEVAFRAAFKYGRRGIVELLSENVSLVYLCYQFLLERSKAEDYNGPLCRAILETMSTFTTLTKEKLEKTHLVKLLPRFQKNGDAKTRFWIGKILTNSENATKEEAEKDTKKDSNKTSGSSTTGNAASATAKKNGPEPVAGVKRPATVSSGDGTAAKKAATGSAKPAPTSAASKINGVVKKPVVSSEGNKAASTAGTAATKKTVPAKSSGFFSSLQSASKKPGTSIADKSNAAGAKPGAAKVPGASSSSAPKPAFSFAETMASLTKPKEEKPKPKPEKEAPPETPEERAKRLRKEQRRKLHVQFKQGDELVSVRYFTHDPEEEIDHDSSQMRDVADVGGEGRMLKQHLNMDLEDDDEGSDENDNLKEYKAPIPIDFSIVPKDERERNYAPYGGGEMEPESAERAKREEYERNNLIVFYTDSSQIPSDPKEPAEPYNGDQGEPLKYFGAPEEQYAARARAKRGAHQGRSYGTQPNFSQAMGSQAGASAGPDISSILASLQQQPSQPSYQQPAPAAPFMGQQFMGGQQPQQQAPQASGGIDLAAILASLQGNQQQTGYGAGGAPPMSFASQPTMYNNGNGGQHKGESSKKGHNKSMYKTKVCRFWQSGTCEKGDACTYIHE